jgi:hypothetical protein
LGHFYDRLCLDQLFQQAVPARSSKLFQQNQENLFKQNVKICSSQMSFLWVQTSVEFSRPLSLLIQSAIDKIGTNRRG